MQWTAYARPSHMRDLLDFAAMTGPPEIEQNRQSSNATSTSDLETSGSSAFCPSVARLDSFHKAIESRGCWFILQQLDLCLCRTHQLWGTRRPSQPNQSRDPTLFEIFGKRCKSTELGGVLWGLSNWDWSVAFSVELSGVNVQSAIKFRLNHIAFEPLLSEYHDFVWSINWWSISINVWNEWIPLILVSANLNERFGVHRVHTFEIFRRSIPVTYHFTKGFVSFTTARACVRKVVYMVSKFHIVDKEKVLFASISGSYHY